MNTEALRMSAEYMADVRDAEQLAFVVTGLTRCHGHHFAVYADEFRIIGSKQAITECVPMWLDCFEPFPADLSLTNHPRRRYYDNCVECELPKFGCRLGTAGGEENPGECALFARMQTEGKV